MRQYSRTGVIEICLVKQEALSDPSHLSMQQLLIHALVISRLDYCCKALLANTSCMRHQTTAARLVFNEPKRSQAMPAINASWLPEAPHIKFKISMLVYRTATGSKHE